MVAGLCPAEDWALGTTALFKETHGLLKRAYAGATYAMDRHLWSKHRSRQMGAATDPVDVRRYSVLLYKIVDGRFNSSDLMDSKPGPFIERFAPAFDSAIRNRIHRWKSERGSNLFGTRAPDRLFLPS
jgi:hypothetical protein